MADDKGPPATKSLCKMTIGEMRRMIQAVKKLGCTDDDKIMFRPFEDSIFITSEDETFLGIHFCNQSKKEKYGTWISSNDLSSHTKKLIVITNDGYESTIEYLRRE